MECAGITGQRIACDTAVKQEWAVAVQAARQGQVGANQAAQAS